jgi:uncharacterized DUF497 family protein
VALEFDWDPDKNERNISKHGISFDEATDVFVDPRRVEFLSLRGDASEVRKLVIGSRGGDVLAVIFTDRVGTKRIISARRASRNERRKYHQGPPSP